MATVTTRGGVVSLVRSLLYNPALRQGVYQALTALAIVWLFWYAGHNAADNLAKANMTSGFGFLKSRAGFDIAQTSIAYSSDSTYFRALVAGLVNTLIVAAAGIVTATLIGLLVGIGRLSGNWLVARLCMVYVEVFRNIPPLLVIFFFYMGVLSLLPNLRASLALPLSVFVSNRGIYLPAAVFGEGFSAVVIAFIAGIAAAIVYARRAMRRQFETGRRPPVFWVNAGLVAGLPLIVFTALGFPVSLDFPVPGRFNMRGGAVIGPEILSLYMALSLYTAAYIAEIIRAGIVGVEKGQTEAAHALGLRPRLTTRLVILPQALRIVIPPLTSEYLNLTKNSSLAVAIGYADLVSVGGTIMNQSGHPIEIIAIWMLIYVSISLATSIFMNWFNVKMALVER